jgi:hypothetical protein
LHMRNDQVFDGLMKYISEYRKTNGFDHRSELLKPILRYFYLNSEIIELLIITHRIDIFNQSFRRLIEPFKPILALKNDVGEDYVEYLIAINTGVVTNILTHWIKSGKKQAPDDLADNIKMMMNSDLSHWASI